MNDRVVTLEGFGTIRSGHPSFRAVTSGRESAAASRLP